MAMMSGWTMRKALVTTTTHDRHPRARQTAPTNGRRQTAPNELPPKHLMIG